MVSLSDYLGLLLSEIAKARVDADIESLRIAEVYSQIDELSNYPVPRVRLQNVEITVPVVIDGVDEDKLKAYKKPVKLADVTKLMVESYRDVLEKNKVTLTDEEDRDLNVKVLGKSKELGRTVRPVAPVEMDEAESVSLLNTRRISGEFSSMIRGHLSELTEKKPELAKVDISRIEKELKKVLDQRITSTRPEAPKINVLVNTHQIKESGPPQALTYLKFQLYEDGMEWSRYETAEGEKKETLVPE